MSKQEFLTLHFKRSKLFMLSGDKGTKRFITGPTREGAIQVPAWVTETQTYQMGIKDGSIVNLTPPEPKIVYVKELPPESQKDEDPKDEDPKDEDSEATKDEDVPEDDKPKSRSRKKKKADGSAGLIATTIVEQ